MNKTLILSELKKHKEFKTEVAFANFLGISPTNLNNWRKRNTFDVNLLINLFTDVNPEWIKTGEGDMLKKVDNRGVIRRINEFITRKGITEYDFCKETDLVIGFFSNTESIMTLGMFRRIISAYPEIDIDWLITGEGKMLKNNDTEPKVSDQLDNPIYNSLIQSSEKIAIAVVDMATANRILAENNTKLMDSNSKLVDTNSKLFESNQKLMDQILSVMEAQKGDVADVKSAATKVVHG